MNTYSITCPLCGSLFNSTGRVSCVACPLHAACSMICCPHCGYTMVAPQDSQLARGATRLGKAVLRLFGSGTQSSSQLHSLADATPGQMVRIRAFGALAPEQRDRLHAYGVQPGQVVRVREQRPVTIIEVEYLELAMEQAIARAVEVEII